MYLVRTSNEMPSPPSARKFAFWAPIEFGARQTFCGATKAKANNKIRQKENNFVGARLWKYLSGIFLAPFI
jgi:hypothetical protein